MQNKATVIYHSADYDGLMSREVAKKFLGTEGVTFLGWDYPDGPIPFPAEGTVYVIDLNPECFGNFPGIAEAQSRVIWIDHHKTAIEKWGTYLPGYRIDGVAASRLAYQWFLLLSNTDPRELHPPYDLPTKQNFLDRKVSEPFGLTLIGEYDVWDHRGDGDLELQFGLRTEEPAPMWEMLLSEEHSATYTKQMIVQGLVAMAYSKHVDASTMNKCFRLAFEGLQFLALNTARANSLTFASRDVPSNGHDALLTFYWNGARWVVTLYHAAHRKDLDLSAIAKRRSGGGHPGACGFSSPQIPFPLYPVIVPKT